MTEESEIVVEPAGDPHPSAPLAAPADEQTVPAVDVEPAADTVDQPDERPDERPDHLRVYHSVQEAFAAQDERFRGHATIPEAVAAYHARRADHSRRLMLWMQGGET